MDTSSAAKSTHVNMETEAENNGNQNLTDSKSDEKVPSETEIPNKSQDPIPL